MSGKNQKYKKSSVVSHKSSAGGDNSEKRLTTYDLRLTTKWWLKYALLTGILIITFWCYHYSLNNQFTNWDDNRCVPENIFIKSFSPANLNMMLFHDAIGDYFNPVTMISYALNYHFSGLNPWSYYAINVIIHLLSSCLMFFFVLMLLKAMQKAGYGIFKWKEWLAFFCTMAFAVHPMHVESVAWIAERPDVLYGFFYIAGLMVYVKYTLRPSYILYFISFLFFVLSLLSKPMALVFPFSLLALDVLLKRDKTTSIKHILLEKLPFICITLLSIITTYHLEKLSGAALQHESNLFQRILFASYSFYMYIVKAFIPIPQSSYYPYPDLSSSGYLPFIFYLSPIIALLVAAIPFIVVSRKSLVVSGKPSLKTYDLRLMTNDSRVILFGLVFYFFNMVMVSKIVSSGPYLLADRYTYMCYFGIFFPVTYFIYKLIALRSSLITYHLSLISAFLVFLAILCEQRTFVWHDSGTLWTDVVEKYPHRIIEAYNSLGNYYFEQRNLDKAYENYQEAIKLNANDPKVFCNMGILMRAKKQYQLALDYYTKAINIDGGDAVTFVNRANIYSIAGRYDLAMKDYQRARSLNPYSEVLLANMAFTWLNTKQFDSAINYYSRLIQINPANSGYFHYRGVAEFEKGAIKPSIADFMQNLRIAPRDSECMYYLSAVYKSISDFNNAYKYAQMAQNAHYPVPENYISQLRSKE